MNARRVGGLAIAVALTATASPLASAESGDAYSENFRLVGAGPASVAAVSASPLHQVYAVAGGGQPAGISASANLSVVAGGTSNLLPTARIFRSGLED